MSTKEECDNLKFELSRYTEMFNIMSQALKRISASEQPADTIASEAMGKCVPIRMRSLVADNND